MKIAIFNRHFSRKAGGAESYSVALAEGLAAEHEVHVFAQDIAHSDPRITYHKVPGPLKRPRWINQLMFATYTWWKTRVGFDVIHSHENTWHGDVQTVHVRPIRFHLFEGQNGQMTGWRRALRWLKIVTSPRLAVYVWLEAARMKLRSNRTVVAVSDLLREQTRAAYPHLPKDMPVILPGVATPTTQLTKAQARRQLSLAHMGEVPLLLFVGNDYARKGLPALLAAMPSLQSNIHLACVGGAAQIPKFQLMAAELGIADRVHFVGSQSDMSAAYRAADILVHPTLEDSFAMVVLEAMSYGLPVVVSSAKYCGISAFLQHEQNALIVQNPLDAKEIAAHVTQILSDATVQAQLLTAGLRFASLHHSDTVVASYLELFNYCQSKKD